MSNFSPKLENATDEQLMHMVNELDFRVVPLASDELTRRTLNELRRTIGAFNEKSSKQTEKMIFLTWGIFALTVVMVIGLGIQVWFALEQTNYTEIQSRSERINQTRAIQEARTRCEQSPELQNSGLYDVSTGKSAPCSQVLQTYK